MALKEAAGIVPVNEMQCSSLLFLCLAVLTATLAFC